MWCVCALCVLIPSPHKGPVAGRTIEFEHTCWDPKDGELCLDRMKPEETLVEVRRRSDVQIDGRIWV